ncbi:sulfotransferase family 2 domain-containing protein [Neobacillus bataviensis]|uniref:sulfotransferase family 2 domain-containing protein n=1 Tax=Neobacillus bataviensis TaxID=220685 RepID=UPI001CBE4BDE|nr:sulfotransferase family 2 domain-containing protein [Neobacillus bataviensis]
MENEQIIFMHIPKTAGRTLRSIIERNYPKEEIIRTYSDEQIEAFKSLPDEEKNKFKFIVGHNYFGMHEFLNGPFSYITMLRDPVERVLSLYFFILREPGTPMYKKYHKKGFEYFLEEEPQTINWQTRFASGGDLDLEKAKANLKNYFSVVGISERFDESLALIEKTCTLNNLKYRNVNVTPNRPKREELSPHIIKKIEENVNLDLELYEYAQKLFEEKLNQN